MDPKLKQLTQFGAAYTAYVIILHTVNGPWRNWTVKGSPSFDTWSLTHLSWGVIAQKMGVTLPVLMGLSAFNEVGEEYLRRIKFMGLWGEPETKLNVLVDMSATATGWLISNSVEL